MNDLLARLVRPVLQEIGVSVALFDLLSTIHAADGRSSQSDIARQLGLSRATISEAISEATDQGLVERQPSTRDRRANTLILTPNGHRLINQILEKIQSVESDVMKRISSKEALVTAQGLKRIIESLQREIPAK